MVLVPSGTLTTEQVDLSDAVGSGAFKTAYNLKGQPDLLVVLLKPRYRATEIKKEIGYLKQLEAYTVDHLQQQALGDPTHKDWNFLKIFFVNA
jgi:hypothetical protein